MTVKQKQEYNKRIIWLGLSWWGICMFFIFLFYFFSNSTIYEVNSWGDLGGHFEGTFFKAILYMLVGTFCFGLAWLIRGEERKSIGIELDGADLPQLYEWRIMIDATIRKHPNYDQYKFSPKDYYLPKPKDEEKPRY